MTALENQYIKNLTWKLAATFICGTFIFGLTISGAVYAYMDKTDKRFINIEIKLNNQLYIDSLKSIYINSRFEKMGNEIQLIKQKN
jgi:hypothetical protein